MTARDDLLALVAELRGYDMDRERELLDAAIAEALAARDAEWLAVVEATEQWVSFGALGGQGCCEPGCLDELRRRMAAAP